tara:strand:+ start:6457 stop:7176 length:720 start_codon:yes stop_codon:yes gene_type:complete
VNISISTLTCSYDSYSFLWEDYKKLFDKYWLLDTHNVVVGETQSLSADNFEFLTPGSLRDDKGVDLWGERMLLGLDKIKTPYVFVMLIDFYFVHDITQDFIEEQIEFLELNNGNKVIIDEHAPRAYRFETSVHPYYKFDNYSDYQTSLMPAVWKTDWLKSVIKSTDTPWIFEVDGTARIKGRDNKVYLNMREAPIFYNVIRRAKNIPETWGPVRWSEFKEKEQLGDYSVHLKSDIFNWE